MPTPLHRLAREARDRLASRADEAEAPEGLVELVREEGRVSVNMKPDVLLDFLENGRYFNTFEWVEKLSEASDESFDEILREELGEWYQLRVDFEERAGAGKHFHYGALNAGGMGAPERYGRYCVVDGRLPDGKEADPVWIVEDSLEETSRFRDSAGQLLWRRFADWVAPADMAAELAAVKFAGTADDGRRLAERLCNDEDYIESASLEKPTRRHTREIRSQTDDALQERALDSFFSTDSREEDLDLDLHDDIRNLAERLGIEWVEVSR